MTTETTTSKTEPRRPLRVSPSQIKRWRQCPRLSAFQFWNTKKATDPFPRANDLGTRCHAIAEAWLRDGTPPDMEEEFVYFRPVRPEGVEKARREEREIVPGLAPDTWEEVLTARPGAIVHAGIHHLPAPGTSGLQVEEEISYKSPATVYAARSDFRDRPQDVPRVGDHKFVRDLGTALSAEPGSVNSYGEPNFLGDDPQFAIQTLGLFLASPEAKEVAGTWVYYETRPRSGGFRTRKVHLAVTKPQALEAMRSVEADSRRIQAVFQNHVNPLDLPPNPAKCQAYGRDCDFRAICNLSEEDVFLAELNEDTMDARVDGILARMMGGQLTPTIVTDDSPPPPPMDDEAPPPPPLDAYDDAPPPPPEDEAPPPPPMEETPATALIYGMPRAVWGALDTAAQEAIIRANKTNLAPGMPQGSDPVNPPEAPPEDGQKGPAAPAKATATVMIPEGGLGAMDRNSLKALAVQRGILPSSSRLGAPAILALLREHETGGPSAETMAAVAEVNASAPLPAPEGLNFPGPGEEGTPSVAQLEHNAGCGTENPCADATPIRAALDRINAARRELMAAEEALHKALGI